MDELAAKRRPPNRGGRVLDMHTGNRTTNDLCDGMCKSGDLGLKLCGSRRLAFEEGYENGQFSALDKRVVFSILVRLERPQPNPRLTGRRIEDATHCVSERLREIVPQRAIRVGDELDREDWHEAQRNKLTGARGAGEVPPSRVRVERRVRRQQN